MEIQISETDTWINQISDNKCMEIDRRNDADKEEAQQRRLIERKVRMLQKRDAERNRYRQMSGEVKARMLQKKRDAKRNRYNQMTGEEKARMLQRKRDAERNRYSQMTGEEKVRMLHKNRNAKRNRYSQMTGEEKARMLQKKREAARNRYNQMTNEEKARMLQRKKEARQMRLNLTESDKVRMIQERKDAHQKRPIEMRKEGEDMLQEGRFTEPNAYIDMTNEENGMMLDEKKATQQKAILLQNGKDSKQNKYNLMMCEENVVALETKREVERKRSTHLCDEEREQVNDDERNTYNNSVHITSGMNCEERVQKESVWGETKENSAFQYNPGVCYELDKSLCVCEYCQAKKWNSEPCGMCHGNGQVHLEPVEQSPETLKTLPPNPDLFLDRIRTYDSAFQVTSLGASRKDNTDVIKVECSVDIETQPMLGHITEAEQEGIPFSFIAVKQEVEEPWADAPVKEELIDEITKEEPEVCFEGDDELPNEQDRDGSYSAVHLDPCLNHVHKHDIEDVTSSKDTNSIYVPTEKFGDNLKYNGQNVIEPDSELSSSNQITKNENGIEHITTQIVGQTYKCEICRKCFPEEGKLINHQRIHTQGKPFKCEICNKFFSHKGGLNKHRRLHTGEKRYKCNICSKCFTEKSHLDRHQRTHTGEKPFKCEICNTFFTQKGSLDTHRRMHSGEKHFKCEICNKYFTRSSYLAVHQRIHTGEKPYTCEFCNKRFRCRGNLVSHIRTHTGD